MWRSLYIPDDILKAIIELKFNEPTPIQQLVLPLAIRDHSDILGSAPTGSGKTLAFGIPLICRVMEAKTKFSVADNDRNPTPEEVIPLPKVSQKIKNRKRQKEMSNLNLETVKMENKRRKIMNELAFIEELDPDTMDVVKVHDLSKKCTVESTNKVLVAQRETALSCVRGLVILPTRELAIQVTSHLRALVKHTSPQITIEAIVGGISLQKQERILTQRRPDIVVATPGRLWEFIQSEHEHVISMSQTLVGVVFDEADRLVESQHFIELGSILKFLRDRRPEGMKRQTFVFSATLAFVHNNAMLPGSNSKKLMKKLSKGKKMDTNSKLIILRDMLDLSMKAKVVDLSSSEPVKKTEHSIDEQYQQNQVNASKAAVMLPTGLSEYRLICQDQVDKDALLVWLLLAARLTNPGRALIFINSKSGARRLSGVLRQCPEISPNLSLLHADMIQKQRLRSLERFQASDRAVVLATDVAARGLDFASCSVAWVIHFDVPRTAEIYIHRCGRTARANRLGRSVVMIAPSDIVHWRKLAKNLRHLPTDKGIPDLLDLQPAPTTDDQERFRSITQVMRAMDEIRHSAFKKDAEYDWFVRTAREADLDIDSDLGLSSDDDEGGPKRRPAKQSAAKCLNSLKQKLAFMLHGWREGINRKSEKHRQIFSGSKKCFVSQDFAA